MASVVDKIVGVLQDAVDYWTGQHPAKRIAPHRDWEYPQIAGYESHPFFKDIKEAFRAVPGSKELSDFTLRRAASPREAAEMPPGTSGWIQQPAAVASIIPLSREQVRYGTAHELGHNYLFDQYRYGGPATETAASKLAVDSLRGRPTSDNDLLDLIYIEASPRTAPQGKEAVRRYNNTVRELIDLTRDMNLDSRKQPSVWK